MTPWRLGSASEPMHTDFLNASNLREFISGLSSTFFCRQPLAGRYRVSINASPGNRQQCHVVLARKVSIDFVVMPMYSWANGQVLHEDGENRYDRRQATVGSTGSRSEWHQSTGFTAPVAAATSFLPAAFQPPSRNPFAPCSLRLFLISLLWPFLVSPTASLSICPFVRLSSFLQPHDHPFQMEHKTSATMYISPGRTSLLRPVRSLSQSARQAITLVPPIHPHTYTPARQTVKSEESRSWMCVCVCIHSCGCERER
ncbi:unnamed protein product [Protopolystoma xenopodis]|uniref:Uncharacterized protein n=1 Tax=Protopolystoma xenopodis TaxID=117903 RepID=A0A3S5B0X6_9PLAT|nr:unnamed protein product [Protopolystoma xenopodis]